MASPSLLLLLSCCLACIASSLQEKSYTVSTRNPGLNVIDACWRSKPNWAANRKSLADCAVGFGKDALGGKFGAIYIVTDSSDDPVNPKPGTLRYGVIQLKPLWIIFARSMVITLKNELIVTSYKTIDGRGVNVEITHGPCITLQYISHVIIHGISIHDCKPGKAGLVRSSTAHIGHRQGSDGDAISIYGSSNIWIDHCFLAHCADGLVDIIHASTAITVSNNYFTQHDKVGTSPYIPSFFGYHALRTIYDIVMLLGHNDKYADDKVMKVTIAFNRFGAGLIERMPRVRFGYAHVANNKYEEWQMYAIGGSANPTIFSEGNYFVAPNQRFSKQVTKREVNSGWKDWKWKSSKDVFMNGAYFVQSGWGSCIPNYGRAQSFPVAPGAMVPALTVGAGPLRCYVGKAC